jgi:hypothetical protein
MEKHSELAVKAYTEACTAVGAYLGFCNKSIEYLEKEIDNSPFGFFRRFMLRRKIKTMKRNFKAAQRDIQPVVTELSRLIPVISDEEVIELSSQVKRLVFPMTINMKMYLQETSKVITLAKLTLKPRSN